ncbi:MAG TPA: hypothetical protein PL110_07575 [Candidatus Eremiobacteraeota bacterium]|nr:MAG: hypothetical protein BWY64_01507 [bacterium ADurb.Bin363]OQA18409.1 MAG: hypothetical protein BWY64_01509 [bacterium ADurb.Bin363]HPZ07956.1 hypothetical protein [Candidatus Eremiobacteraeota bacterium]
MNNKGVMIFTIILLLFSIMAPVLCFATQVTPTYRWSPARPEKVIEQFFEAQCAKDYDAIKCLMLKNPRDLRLPDGSHVSLVGWSDYNTSNLYIKSVKLINIIKLDLYSDPSRRLECYQVLGDFTFDNWAPLKNGPYTYYIYLERDERDVWKLYAPELRESGPRTSVHNQVQWDMWYD